jgi:putative oxidoreductase
MERVNDAFLLVGRLLMGALFLTIGGQHALQGYGGGFAKYLGSLGVPSPEIMAVVAAAVEVIGGVGLILGVFPSLTALLLVVFMIVATALAHRYWEYADAQYANQMNHFLKNVAILGGLLFYYVSGAGAWSLAGRRSAVGTASPARA